MYGIFLSDRAYLQTKIGFQCITGNGYKLLLRFLREELQANTIDGFFVNNQDTYRKRPQKILEFRRAIAQVENMSAAEVEAKIQQQLRLY